jgi:hypothetical protein
VFRIKPVFVVAAMEAHIPDMRGYEVGGTNRFA